MERLGVSGERGLRKALPVRPPGLRELIRVATLPRPRMADVEPAKPTRFHHFEVEDPQGIAYGGGTRWFLSSQGTVRRCTIEGDDPFRPESVRCGDVRGLRGLLQEAGLAPAGFPPELDFDHIGDLAYARQLVYAPIRRSTREPPHVVLGLARDFRVVGFAVLLDGTGESACAINPWNGFLYVPSSEETGLLWAYDVSPFLRRFEQPSQWGAELEIEHHPEADIRLQTPGGDDEPEGMQGIAFSANGRLFVSRSGPGPFVNRISVYNALTGRRFGDGRTWDFRGDGDEIEGIALHPSGVLYVSVNDNDAEVPPISQDNFDLYTLRFESLSASEV